MIGQTIDDVDDRLSKDICFMIIKAIIYLTSQPHHPLYSIVVMINMLLGDQIMVLLVLEVFEDFNDVRVINFP